MKISVIGTGYVGLVTGVCLSDINHEVTCIDIDKEKVAKMQSGISPIYEPGLDELITINVEANRLSFTTNHAEGFAGTEVIIIAVGTPQEEDGSADLTYIKQAAKDIASYITNDVVVVTKSTVPVGTNEIIQNIIAENIPNEYSFNVVSNPEFLREGSAIFDTMHGDRVVIGSNYEAPGQKVKEMYEPLNIPFVMTDIRSAEMIKYASNAFLATKISFVNEISNICEKLNANIEDVTNGMGLDERIGNRFLNAGIGYGGSCFPKDTKALVQIAGNVDHKFDLLESVINVNNQQQAKLVGQLKGRLGDLRGKTIGILGLSFKPNTDDMREAASIRVIEELRNEGAIVQAYDPIAIENAKSIIGSEQVDYVNSCQEAIRGTDAALILTEWDQIKDMDLDIFVNEMKQSLILDGRNCYDLQHVKNYPIEYYSIGRPPVVPEIAYQV